MKITLKEIIGQFSSSAKQGSEEFLRLWNLASWGLKTEFNLDITGEIKTEILDVNPNKTVCLPCDYIQYLKIGVVNERGEVVTFKRNDRLSTLISSMGDNRLSGAPLGGGSFENLYKFYSNNYYGYFLNGSSFQLFGANSGTPTIGQYKVDEAAKLIFLDVHCHYSEIVMEYLSDGYDEGSCDYSVDVRCAEAMKCYLRWQNAVDQPKKFGQGTVKDFRIQFYNEKRKAKVRLNPFIISEAVQIHAAAQKLVPKV